MLIDKVHIMDERETVKNLEKWAEENVRYFSNPNKESTERWIVSDFLTTLCIEHHNTELKSLEQESKIDVCFRAAKFQVKELPDPNLLRGKIYKDALNSIKVATSIKEVSLIGEIYDLPPITDMYTLVLEKSRELSNKEIYKHSKGEIDLLIYVTRTRASIIQAHEIQSEEFSSLGWRSISCLNTKQAVVLFSSPSAPTFIIEKNQKIVSREIY